ncbi:MAG: hypothetical protein M3430_17640 [Acidobacteriota bacterium]|nr:hypothetical protein [Acidobacteriota bacterium]
MRFWQLFWTASLLIAGASFAFITMVVTFKGFHDLREWFSSLKRQKEAQEERAADAEMS